MILVRPSTSATDILAEEFVDFGARRRRVLDRVVQQSDRDGRFIEVHFGENGGDFERVGNIGIAAGPLLLAMLLHGVDIGLVQKGFVDIGLVFLNALNELVLAHHP